MSQAIIKTGGKQYLVQDGGKVKVEQLTEEVGKKVVFEEVLMVVEDDKVTLGDPLLKGAVVEGKVLQHDQTDKVFGAKVKAKKRYKKYFSHRQQFTEVEITKIKA